MQNDYTLKCFLNLEIKWIVNAMKLLKNFESLFQKYVIVPMYGIIISIK